MFFDASGRVVDAGTNAIPIRFRQRSECPSSKAEKDRYSKETKSTSVSSAVVFEDSVVVKGVSQNVSTRVSETYVFVTYLSKLYSKSIALLAGLKIEGERPSISSAGVGPISASNVTR